MGTNQTEGWIRRGWILLGLATLLAPLQAQSNPPAGAERMSVPFSDPSAPRRLIVDTMLGAVSVTGYDGQEAIVDVTERGNRRRRPRTPVPEGMRRIGGGAAGVEVTERNNVVRVSGGIFGGSVAEIAVQVPRETSVSVETMTGRDIHIENISGEIEVNNMNGAVEIVNASGSVVAHSMNGKVTVSLDSVMPDKPMSFSTMNGDIDVTLPSQIQANVKLKSDHGDMFTDFDIQLLPSRTETQNNRGRGGAFRVRTDRATYGTINGGGADFQFTTFNGNIVLRKR